MKGSFVDTNIIIYSLSQDEIKQNIAIELLSKQPIVSIQVLSETANVMRKKLGFDILATRLIIDRIASECSTIVPLTISTLREGLTLSENYSFSHYDSLIVASAIEAGCNKLYSEDMHHGLIVNQCLTILNPFRST